MYVQPSEGALAQGPFAPLGDLGEGAMPFSPLGAFGGLGSDGISRLLQPPQSGTSQFPLQSGAFGPLAGLMQQLVQLLQQMLGAGSGQSFFASANGASQGDPHLSFNGSQWTSMASQPDLLQSSSMPGGFQISTQVTPPNAGGVSWNQSATVTMNNGATSVSLNDAGQASIVTNGQSTAIAPGQTVRLGNGQSVKCNRNGSLTVDASNGMGGNIETTLSTGDKGVNVAVSAQNVDLGGALVQGTSGSLPMPGFSSLPIPLPPLPSLPLEQIPT